MKNSGKRTDILFGVDALGVNMYPKDNQLNPTVSNRKALVKKTIQVPLFKNRIIYREESKNPLIL